MSLFGFDLRLCQFLNICNNIPLKSHIEPDLTEISKNLLTASEKIITSDDNSFAFQMRCNRSSKKATCFERLSLIKMNSTDANEYALILHKYVSPLLIGIGTVGHLLTVIAVNGPASKKTSFTTYLTTLAIVAFLVLYTLALNTWLQYAFGVVVDGSAVLLCKLCHYSTFVLPEMSSWLVMCLYIERTVCVYSDTIGKMPGRRFGLTVVVINSCVYLRRQLAYVIRMGLS